VSISIVLADDHTILRQGLRALLEAEADFSVVADTGDGLEVLGLVDTFHPNIVVLDLEMPGVKGLEVTRQIQKQHKETRVVILSMYAKEAYVLEALKNGASGYVLKGSEVQDLILAIRRAISGQRYLSPPLSERAIDVYLESATGQILDPFETLTNRERQILHLAAEGFSSTEIANRLVISTRTVETHRSRMMRKLGLKNQVDLIRYSIKTGIISLEE